MRRLRSRSSDIAAAPFEFSFAMVESLGPNESAVKTLPAEKFLRSEITLVICRRAASLAQRRAFQSHDQWCAERMPIGPGTDQRERRARICPTDRFYEQPQGSAVLQNLIGHRMHRRLGIFGAELCDDHHTLPALLFVAPTPMLGPLLRRNSRQARILTTLCLIRAAGSSLCPTRGLTGSSSFASTRRAGNSCRTTHPSSPRARAPAPGTLRFIRKCHSRM